MVRSSRIPTLIVGLSLILSPLGFSLSFTDHVIATAYNNPWDVFGIDLDSDDGVNSDGDLDVLGAAQFANLITWWENSNVAINEGDRKLDSYYTNLPTIIHGPLHLPKGLVHRMFDITGRLVQSLNPKPGIYFIEIEGGYLQKFIKVQ
jgi:hypothetical protein